jgi:hypothetical protein
MTNTSLKKTYPVKLIYHMLFHVKTVKIQTLLDAPYTLYKKPKN